MAGRESLFSFLRRRMTVRGIWRGRGSAKLIWRSSAWCEGRPTFQGRFKRRNPVDHKRLRVGQMEVWW